MLTYFVCRQGYIYYKKQQDDRLYKADVRKRRNAGLVDSNIPSRPLPPVPDYHKVASASIEDLSPLSANDIKDIEDIPTEGAQETALVAFAPPPPRSTRISVGSPAGAKPSAPPPRITITSSTSTARPPPPPPPPPKPAALASNPIPRPKPPPKPAALSSALVPTAATNPPASNRQYAAKPNLPARSTFLSDSQAVVPYTSRTPPPSLPRRLALLAPSEVVDGKLKRSNSTGATARNINGYAGVRRPRPGENEVILKPQTFAPPPGFAPLTMKPARGGAPTSRFAR